MSELNGDDLKKLIESNARSIEALSASHSEIAEAQRRAEKEMADMRETFGQEMAALRETLADLARFQANALANCNNAVANLNYALADVVKKQGETSAETYRLINKLESRQGEIVKVMKLLVEKSGESENKE
ncbi:MAG: hypothetical protein F6J93_15130 [Oscillatoria sp. SIO1A7]|nr:hypothetical protein [Oscillatoria sp. SIO1A7]